MNFGGPQAQAELVPFLVELLTDVLPFPAPVLAPAARLIANRRAPIVGPNYAEIGWSPLVPQTVEIVEALRERLGTDLPIAMGMMFTAPTAHTAVRELLDQGCNQVVVLGLFPHYSLATMQAAYSFVHEALQAQTDGSVAVHYVPAFFDDPLYIEALAQTIRQGADELPGEGPIHLLFSPHGLPLNFVHKKGDPYPEHVRESVRRVVTFLDWQQPWDIAWQSRVGPTKWLTPSTLDAVEALGAAKTERVLIVPISFVGEGIETLHELDIEVANHAKQAGVRHIGRAPALRTEAPFLACLEGLVRTGLDQLGVRHCARCKVPKGTEHFKRARCPNCAFATPSFQRET